MKSLEQIKEKVGDIENITSNTILNLTPETIKESLLLQTFVNKLKEEIKEKLLSDISHLLR